jgi:hypothetical protein
MGTGKLKFVIMMMCVVGFAAPAFTFDFSFHGDLNNRFTLYTKILTKNSSFRSGTTYLTIN